MPVEHLTVRVDQNLDDVWLELCRTVPNAVLLQVHGQKLSLWTIQYLKEWRYDILYILLDGNCTWYKGILLSESPIIWGYFSDVIAKRYPNSGIVIPHQYRTNPKQGRLYRHTRQGIYQRKTLRRRGLGPIYGRLFAYHTMDFVPWAAPGPKNKMPKKWIS